MRCMVCGTIMDKSLGNYYECPNCGHKSESSSVTFSNCDIPVPQGFGKQEGWICPVCGRGVAPWASSCPCQSDWKITYGTGTSGINTELKKLFELNDARISEIIEFNKKYGD